MKHILILACAIAGLTTTAFAEGKANEAALAKIKIDTVAAVKAAEAYAPGKVASLDIDEDDQTGEPFYAVEVVDSAGKEHKLQVNGVTGTATIAKADADHEGEDKDAD